MASCVLQNLTECALDSQITEDILDPLVYVLATKCHLEMTWDYPNTEIRVTACSLHHNFHVEQLFEG